MESTLQQVVVIDYREIMTASESPSRIPYEGVTRMLQEILSSGMYGRTTQIRLAQWLYQIKAFLKGLLWALVAIAVTVFLFLVLYSSKSLLGIDIFPSVHFRDIVATFTM